MAKFQGIIILIFQFNLTKIICSNCTILIWIKQVISNRELKYLIINNNKVL